MEGFSAFLGKAEFSEPAYWTDEDGITLRKPSKMHYRQHGREHCFSKLLDRNQKLVYSLDETLLDRYALLSETILLEPSLATDCLEYVKELYYQEDAPIFDTLFPVIEAMLAKKIRLGCCNVGISGIVKGEIGASSTLSFFYLFLANHQSYWPRYSSTCLWTSATILSTPASFCFCWYSAIAASTSSTRPYSMRNPRSL